MSRRRRTLRSRARSRSRNGLSLLSMGMSADFPLAIVFGATHVRVGTAIFGARPPLRLDGDPRFRAKSAEHAPQVRCARMQRIPRSATIRPRHVQKHGAASVGDPRAPVVIELDHEIVEMIRPPQAVPWFIGRAVERPIVAAVAGIFTPGQIGRNASRRQGGGWARMAVRPPPQAQQPEPTPRSGAVALEFVGPNAGAAEHDRDGKRSCEHHPPGPVARQGAYADQGERAVSHGTRL